MVIRILDVVPGADTSDQGDVVFALISRAFSQSGAATVSFNGLKTATSSFVDAAFVPLLKSYSFADIELHLQVVDPTWEINDIIKLRLELENQRKHARERGDPGREYMKQLSAEIENDQPRQEPDRSRFRGIDRGGR
jgi:hypothetical protein